MISTEDSLLVVNSIIFSVSYRLDREIVGRQQAEDKHRALERKQEFDSRLQQEVKCNLSSKLPFN